MTHAELRGMHKAPGLEPTSCPGELAILEPDGRFHPWTTDRSMIDADGHALILSRCAGCGHRIALDRTAGVIRNDTPYPDGSTGPPDEDRKP